MKIMGLEYHPLESTVVILCNVISLCSLMNYNQMGAENKLHFIHSWKAVSTSEQSVLVSWGGMGKGRVLQGQVICCRLAPSAKHIHPPSPCHLCHLSNQTFSRLQQPFHDIFLETRILQTNNIFLLHAVFVMIPNTISSLTHLLPSKF